MEGPGKRTGMAPEGAAGWSVREARSPIRAAGNAVLAGNRLGPSGPRQLSVPEKRIRDAWREASEMSSPAARIGELKEDGIVKTRLEQLEERIQKLHQLEGRMMTQYTSQRAREATAVSNSWSEEPQGFTLPNVPMHSPFPSGSPSMPATAATTGVFGDVSGRPSTMQELFMRQPPATSQGLLAERRDSFGRNDARAFQPRPTIQGWQGPRDPATLTASGSIELVRTIMRDELQGIHKESSIVRSPKREISFALDDSRESVRSKADSDSTEESIIMPANKSGVENDSDDEIKRPPSPPDPQLESPTSSEVQSLLEEEQRRKMEEKHKQHRKTSIKPKTLEDAVLVSCPYLFGGFPRWSPVRRACWTIQSSIYWQAAFMVITVTNSIYIATAPGYTDEFSIRISWWFDFICACIFGFEVLSGMIAYGAFMGKSTYLHNDMFHSVDLMCFFFLILEYASVAWEMWPDLTMRPFRMVRVFKPITMTKTFSGVKLILISLSDGAPQLGVIFAFLFLTVIGWNVLLVSVYGSSTRRQCVTVDTFVPKCASDFSTGFNATCNFNAGPENVFQPGGTPTISGGYPFRTWCKIIATEHDQDASGKWVQPKPEGKLVTKGYYDYSHSKQSISWPKYNGTYHSCQASAWRKAKIQGEEFEVTQTCANVGNPQMGFSHFDNVYGASVTMFQLIAHDSYYDVWFRTMEGDPDLIYLTYIIFPLITVLDTFLLLGLFVAVVTGTFKRIRNEQKFSQFTGQKTNETDPSLPEALLSPTKHSMVEDEKIEVKDDITQIQEGARILTKHWTFDSFIHLTILWHIISLGFDTFDAPDFQKAVCYWSNVVCSALFVAECVLNYMARNSASRFFLVHKTEFIMAIIGLAGIASDITIVKVICALRGYRLVNYFKTLEALLTSARASFLAIVNVCVFTILVGLCFCVTGRYLIGDRMNELTRSNFSSLFMASLTMFQLFTGDSWSSVMYAAMQCMPTEDWMSQGAAAVFVLTWFVFAYLVVNNLFVAVILEHFEIAKTLECIASDGHVAFWRNQLKVAYDQLFRTSNEALGGALTISNQVEERRRARLVYLQKFGDKAELADTRSLKTLEKGLVSNPVSLYRREAKDYVPPIMKALTSVALDTTFVPKEQRDIPPPQRVLYLFAPDSPIRRAFAWLGRQAFFENLVLICILISCYFLIIDPPYRETDPNPAVPYAIMDVLNPIFTFVFSLEFAVRVLGQGLIFTQGAYLKSGWNRIDTVVLVFAWLEELRLPGMEEGGLSKILRMGRAMKPLRLMKRNKSMRHLIDALLGTLRPLLYVIIFLLFTLVIFSCIAQGLFGGRLFKCTDPALAYPNGKTECSGLWYTDTGIMMPSAWANPYFFDFDSFLSSGLSLFQISCFNYVSILHACMDITEFERAPKKLAYPEASAFFVVYILVGGMFVMKLFIGFVVDGFHAMKGESEAEIIFGRYKRQLKQHAPFYDTFLPPGNIVSSYTRKLITHSAYQTFTTLCLFTNVVFLLADTSDSKGTEYGKFQDLQNFFFFCVLVLEVILMIIGFGPGGLYNDLWRLFDFTVCLATALGYISQNDALTSVARICRLGRVIRLMRRFEQIRIIIETMVKTLPQLANVIILLILVYSMAAVLGVQLFSTTKPGLRMGPTANFYNFTAAIQAIWSIVCGDQWMVLLADCSVEAPSCTSVVPNKSWNDCGSRHFAYAYFVGVKIVCEFIMLNLFIGLIIDNFSYITEDVGHEEDDNWTEGPSVSQLKNLCRIFQGYDGSTGFVPIHATHCILCDLPVPLGYRSRNHTVKFSGMDRLLEHMIRAELNVLIRTKREEEKDNEKRLLYRIRRYFKPEGRKLFTQGVSYEDLILVATYWRLPRLVPDEIKFRRQGMVQDSAVTAAVLTIAGFFRLAGAIRKKARIEKLLMKKKSLEAWVKQDAHRKRHHDTVMNKRRKQREMAKEFDMAVGILLPEPVATHDIVLEYVANWPPGSEEPMEFMPYSRTLKEVHKGTKIPQPINGIEQLRKMFENNVLILKPVDPIMLEALTFKDEDGEAQIDLLAADFGGVRWRGWHATNTQIETYYAPMTFFGFDDKGKRVAHQQWERMQVWLQSKHKRARANNKNRLLGSCLNFQSFITDDPTSNSEKAVDRAICHLRLNLGSHEFDSAKIKHEAYMWKLRRTSVPDVFSELARAQANFLQVKPDKRDGVGKDERAEVDMSDGVFDVLGYLPRTVFEEKYMDRGFGFGEQLVALAD